jgi:hypothetical protein
LAWRAKFCIRIVDYPLDRSPYEDERSLPAEKEKALRGERSDGVAAAVEEDA